MDTKKTYFTARSAQRKISAMAMLKSTDKRRQTRTQMAKISEQISHTTEIGEMSDLMVTLMHVSVKFLASVNKQYYNYCKFD